MRRRPPETEPHGAQAQLELPLGCLPSASAVRLQNHEPSKPRRSRLSPARVAKFQEMRELRGIVPVSCKENSEVNKKRQGHYFVLTPLLLSLINEVNAKRWASEHVAALPSFVRRPIAVAGQGRAHVGRRSSGRLPAYPLGRD